MNWWISKLAGLTRVFMASCRETSERCTDLIEGDVPEAELVRVRRHLKRCPACQAYHSQMETGVRALRELPRQELAEAEKEDLMRRFRERRVR
jgi:anti-sigma factor RsiW